MPGVSFAVFFFSGSPMGRLPFSREDCLVSRGTFKKHKGDWTNLQSVAFRADQSDVLLLAEEGSNNTRLPIGARGRH